MTALKNLIAGALRAGPVGLVGIPPAQADPFTPAEIQFLNDVRPRLQSYGDPRPESMSIREFRRSALGCDCIVRPPQRTRAIWRVAAVEVACR